MVRLRSPNRPAAPGFFSRRDLWRLFSLVLAVAMVGFLIRELRRPRVAARVDQVMPVDRRARAGDSCKAVRRSRPADPGPISQSAALAGWDAERFANFGDGTPLSDAQTTGTARAATASQDVRRGRNWPDGHATAH